VPKNINIQIVYARNEINQSRNIIRESETNKIIRTPRTPDPEGKNPPARPTNLPHPKTPEFFPNQKSVLVLRLFQDVRVSKKKKKKKEKKNGLKIDQETLRSTRTSSAAKGKRKARKEERREKEGKGKEKKEKEKKKKRKEKKRKEKKRKEKKRKEKKRKGGPR
jgi:hypothetical protein